MFTIPARQIEDDVLIPHLKRGAVLWPGLPPVVEARGGNVGMPEPLLHLGDVGLMVERVGRGSGSRSVRAEALDVYPHTLCVVLHHLVDAVRGDGALH
jgi:hypothetical protein